MTLIADNPKETIFVVELKPQEGFGPFDWMHAFAIPSRDPLTYTNVPKDIDEYVVRKLILSWEHYYWLLYLNNEIDSEMFENLVEHYRFQMDDSKLSDSLTGAVLILIGTRGGKRVIIIDSDNDKDFGNEKILEYEYPLTVEEQEKIKNSLPVISVQFEYVENGQIRSRKVDVRPTPYAGWITMTFESAVNEEIQNKYQLFFTIPEHKKGEMKINGVDFDVFVANCFSVPDYSKDRHSIFGVAGVSVFINPKSTPLLSEREGNIPHKIGDIFNVAGYEFSLDSISRWGDQLFIKHIGKNERATGVTEGFYLPDFTANYLNGAVFDLEKYADKYILFNFWGTWCAPCIAKIPELKKFNAEFSDNKNFVLVNVAFDNDREKVLNFVAKENMNWPQLFVNQRQRDENSLINKLRITSYPTMILVSPERKIIGRNYREIDELKELLIEKTKPIE